MTAGVSVVVPTYNGSRFIRDAMQSVFAQTFLPREIIVVDDCSSDDTVEVVKAIASDAPVPVRVLHLSKNSGGPARPINVGVAEATGEFVAVLDQDDVFHPEKLAREQAALDAHPNCAVAFGFCSWFDSGKPIKSAELRSEIIARGTQRTACIEIEGTDLLEVLIAHNNILMGYPAFSFRRRLWEERGGADESLKIASDLDVLGWFLSRGNGALVPHIVYSRRRHDQNASGCRVRTYAESAQVRTRLIQYKDRTRQNAHLRGLLREEFLTRAYWFREAGEYAAARTLLKSCRQLGAPFRQTAFALLKCVAHRILRYCGARSVVSTGFVRPPEQQS